MKLEKYLVESDKPIRNMDTIIDLIQKDCKPFLRDLKGANNWLSRNMSNKYDRGFIVPRKRREPRDTNKKIHKGMDSYLDEKFGFKGRSEGVFCSGQDTWGSAYGHPYAIFPKGDYRVVWSPEIEDSFVGTSMHLFFAELKPEDIERKYPELTKEVIRLLDKSSLPVSKDYYMDYAIEIVQSFINDKSKDGLAVKRWGGDFKQIMYDMFDWKRSFDTYRMGYLKNAINSKKEIMLQTSGYYYIERYSNGDDMMKPYQQLFGVLPK